MTIRKLVAITQLAALPESRPRLVNGPDGRRFVCIRRGARVDVLDDRCPHEGHPLSMGVLNGEVLTCQWHNWKFDIETGGCRFGGESVRHYETDVVDGELFVELDEGTESRRFRVAGDLADAVMQESIDGIVRNGLRCAEVTADARAGLGALARLAAERSPWGLRGAIGAIDAVARLASRGVLDVAEALALAGVAVVHDAGARGSRVDAAPIASTLADAEGFLLDLVEERRAEAAARVRGLPDDVTSEAVTHAWFVPFVSMKLWDRGAALIRSAASARIAAWVEPAAARAITVAHAVALGWAVSESDLPPWRATRQALLEARTIRAGAAALADGDTLRSAVLASERDAVSSVLETLRAGADPRAILEAVRSAALLRLARYDTRHSRRAGVDVTVLEPARAFVFAHEALSLADSAFGPAHAILAAALVGKLARFDGGDAHDASTTASFAERLEHARIDAAERALASMPDEAIEGALRDAVRAALLGTVAPATTSDACLLAAAICDVSENASVELRRLALRAFVRAMFSDGGPRLDRLAANAARFVRDGTPPEML